MYTPKYFRMEEQAALNAMMRAYDFAIVLVPGEPDLAATHIPLKLDDGRQMLIGHVAQANPIAQAIRDGKEAVVIFSGPHAYVSPTWYSDPDNNVPTWNYMAVHAFGHFIPLEGEAAERSLSSQIADFESDWRITNIELGQRVRLESAIQAFEFKILRLEGKAKLSQNKPAKERLLIARALEARGENAVAHHMTEVGAEE